MPETTGTLEALDGERVRAAPDVLEARFAEPGRRVRAAGSNNEYLGHVMAADPAGPGARARVEALLDEVRAGLVIR
ncbi:hypothetical protein SHKM778_25390 [Streptomyces sp. KM77-8]|uniref:L-amino acid ligase C-terminal domain-containing protein n=1 Tax=Streptomyces haneummycinicus TaxID=3074435 RepID=A0AAT9HFM2_9ACTN